MIDETNINTVNIVAAGLTASQYTDSGLTNGTYYYGIVAVDAIGYLYISNIEAVVVTITTPITTSTTASSTPDFTFAIAFVAILVTMIYRKQSR